MADLKEMLDQGTQNGLSLYGHQCSRRFYELLSQRQFQSTRCLSCGRLAFPPRNFCPACFQTKLAWMDLPRRGTLYAFTQQERSVRFGKPDVIGIVELAGGIRLLTRVDGKFESLRLGQAVELDFLELAPGLVLHQFRPAGIKNERPAAAP